MSSKKNPYKIEPIKGRGKEQKPLGWELFPKQNASIYISASTKSGKTTQIKHIIKYCTDRRTKVFIFAPTVQVDDAYKDIMEYMDKKGIEYEVFPHFIDENGVHIIKVIMDALDQGGDLHDAEEVETKTKPIVYTQIIGDTIVKVDVNGIPINQNEEPSPSKSTKKAQSKYSAPPYMFILDDLGEDLRNKDIYRLLMRQRHYKGKTIISSQYLKNLQKNSIEQLDYILLFGGHSDENILDLKQKISFTSISDGDFLDLYHYATAEKYNFMYIDRRDVIIKKNYDEILYAK